MASLTGVVVLGARRVVRRLTWPVRVARYRGAAVACSVCDRTAARFIGLWADCPFCGARPRHRFLRDWLAPQLRPGDALLHVAPEPVLARRLRAAVGAGYVSVDLASPYAMVRADLADPMTVARLGGARFRWVLCSHVLEHVPDDLAAMRTLGALLAPGGELVVQVPHEPARAATYEDPKITDPAGRLAAFGQEDHVRIYATADLPRRLERAGLRVRARYPDAAAVARLGLNPADPLFCCTR